MGQYFGTDGIRGRWGSAELNLKSVFNIAQAVSTWLTQNFESNQVMIAGDTRASTAEIIDCMQRVLVSHGIDVQLLGVLPSPGLACMLRCSTSATFGIMVTASHNPAQDNGIKLFDSDGCKLPKEQEQVLDVLMSQTSEHKPLSIQSGHTQHVIAEDYEQLLRQQQSHLKGFFNKVVVDAANGAGSNLSTKLLSELGSEIIVIANQPDGHNINLKCGATHPEYAQTVVIKHQADCGVVLDGDADRVMLIDNEGKIINGDGILFILAKYHQPKGVVGTLMSNYGLEKALSEMNIGFERTDVGDKYVIERLKQRGWLYGAESSGHVINLQLNPTGDGLLTAFQIMNIAAQQASSISNLLEGYEPYPQILINIQTAQPPKTLMQSPAIKKAVNATQQALEGKGRVLVRASGTEPIIRVMVEAKDAELAESSAQSIGRVVESVM